MGDFTNVTVWAEDPAMLADWYVQHAGLRLANQTPRFSLLEGSSGAAIGFHVGTPLVNPGCVQFHVQVDDVDKTARALRDSGVEIAEPPTDRPWGVRSASCFDPAGHSVEFFTPTT